MFTSVNAPRITSLTHADLVKWKRDREEHEDQVRNRVEATGEDERAVLASAKDSFDRRLLKTACCLCFNTNKCDRREALSAHQQHPRHREE